MKNANLIVQEYVDKGKVIVLSLNRPKQLNAINKDLLLTLRQHLDVFQMDQDLDALIISSGIMKSFCTGIDVGDVQEMGNMEAAEFFTELAELLELLINFPCTTIAAINGYAYGAGADLAISCDLRIGSASSSFRFPGPQFGVILGTQRLLNEVGPAVTREIVLTGKKIDAKMALRYGLLNEIVETNNCLEVALNWAMKISHIPKYTQLDIKNICISKQPSQKFKGTSVSLTRRSVLEGNFHERFMNYMERVRKKSN